MEEVLRIGSVISVKGRQVEVQVDKTKNTPHLLYNGEVLNNVSVGSYIKICKGFESIVGKIDGEYITEDKYNQNKDYQVSGYNIKRVLIVSILGYFDKGVFKQGIKELPLIYNECYILTQQEFDKVHNFLKVINGALDIPIDVACLASETGKRISLGVNSLFASHIGIFGNTGSGKSYTLAGLYHKLFQKYSAQKGFQQNAKFLIFDFNGEYSSANCITTEKTIFNLSTHRELADIDSNEKLPLGESLILDLELLSILANATDKTQRPYLKRCIDFYHKVANTESPVGYFRRILKNNVERVLAMTDKEKAFALFDYLVAVIDYKEEHEVSRVDFDEKCEWNNTFGYYMLHGVVRQIQREQIQTLAIYENCDKYEFPDNILDKIIHFLYIQIIQDIALSKAKLDHISPAIHKLKSKSNDLQKVIDFSSKDSDIFRGKNMAIINLNDCKIDIKKIIPLLLSSKVYSEHKIASKSFSGKYLNIIIDEAHNILSYNSDRESEIWKDYRLEVFEEIIKEGRKFGVFLTIASQRPSDISSTIISQLHNYFLHRLINNKDIEAVERTISYLDRVSFDALPILPTGSCILAGLAAQVPVIVQMDKIDDTYEPYNKTIKLTDYWS